MIKYELYKTDKFLDELIDILLYVKEEYSIENANEYLNYIEEQCELLKQSPYLGTVPRYQSIAKLGYRALICKQNIVFYSIDELNHIIIIKLIVYSKKHYLNLL